RIDTAATKRSERHIGHQLPSHGGVQCLVGGVDGIFISALEGCDGLARRPVTLWVARTPVDHGYHRAWRQSLHALQQIPRARDLAEDQVFGDRSLVQGASDEIGLEQRLDLRRKCNSVGCQIGRASWRESGKLLVES